MSQPHGDNISSISRDDGLCHLAMQLFRATGHTFNTEAAISNKTIRDFVYFDIRHNQVLTPTDWSYLNNVISASLLFSNGSTYFDVPNCNTEIEYYAMSLNVANSERSLLAHEIHKVIARLSMASLSVILFKVNEFYMFSFAERKHRQQSIVILSDWFSLNDFIETDLLLQIDAAFFASTSVKDFFYDFEYAIARSYYNYPMSYEYAGYEIFPLKLFNGNDGTILDRETINQIMRDNYLFPLRAYQDDYVGEDYNNRESQSFSTDDFVLDLLDFDMDTIESDEEDFPCDDIVEDDKLECEGEDDYLDELDEELFEDPIKMLKWIKKHIRA